MSGSFGANHLAGGLEPQGKIIGSKDPVDQLRLWPSAQILGIAEQGSPK